MSYHIALHQEAEKEYEASYVWYELRQEGLGERFITLVKKKLAEVAERPDSYPKKKGPYREVPVDVFPYIIVYTVDKKRKLVIVLAIYHTSRNPLLKYRK